MPALWRASVVLRTQTKPLDCALTSSQLALMTPTSPPALVHSPLAEWARTRGDTVAIAVTISAADSAYSSAKSVTFAALHNAVVKRAQALVVQRAPHTLLIDPHLNPLERLVEFLGIVSSGRCAAVADADWPAAVMHAVQAAMPQLHCDMPHAHADSPFYVGFTSGSTGSPKGFRRTHGSWVESFRVCVQDFGPHALGRIFAPGRDAHSLFLFGMLLGLWSGAGVVVQERFSASAALDTLRNDALPALITAPSQLLTMMDVARHRNLPAIQGVKLIMISGARWPRSRNTELRALFPQARVIEFYGASETSFVAWMDSDETVPADVVGRAFSNVQLQIRKPENINKDDDTGDVAGMIYVRSPMVFMDYFLNSDGTAAERDGEWISVRDLGRLDCEGRLHLTGRQNRMIVTQGKNLFAEELEAVLEAHPAIAAASVHGVDDALRGAAVVAVIRWADTADRPNTAHIANWCKQHLEAYKAPRKIYVCADWPLTASGKTHHSRLGEGLAASASSTPSVLPCLQALP